MTDAPSRSSARLLEILAAKIAAETGVDSDLARELAASALSSPSVDEDDADRPPRRRRPRGRPHPVRPRRGGLRRPGRRGGRDGLRRRGREPGRPGLPRHRRPRQRAALTARKGARGKPGGPGPPRPSSVRLQVLVDLPRVDPGDVGRPLGPLGLDEVLEDVLAERVLHDVVLLEAVERLGEVRRELVDLPALLLALAHLEDVLVHRLARPRSCS